MKNKKFTILIAEDDIISFELYKARLEEFDLNILHAKNGKVAIEIVKNNPNINLILMDIRMPVLDGYQATKEIRKFNPDIPVYAQSAFALIPEKKTIKQSGFNGFLPKPVEEEQLISLINKFKDKI